MAPLSSAVTMDVVVHVVPVPSDKNVAEDPVFVHQTVPVDNVVMMDAEDLLVEPAPQLKAVQTESVSELPPLTVLAESVDLTELEETVVPVQLAKDADLANVNATMTVMNETVEMLFRLKEPTSDCAPNDLAVHVLMVLLVDPMEDVLL